MKKIPPVLQKILMERAATASRKNEPGDGYGYGIDMPHGYEVILPSEVPVALQPQPSRLPFPLKSPEFPLNPPTSLQPSKEFTSVVTDQPPAFSAKEIARRYGRSVESEAPTRRGMGREEGRSPADGGKQTKPGVRDFGSSESGRMPSAEQFGKTVRNLAPDIKSGLLGGLGFGVSLVPATVAYEGMPSPIEDAPDVPLGPIAIGTDPIKTAAAAYAAEVTTPGMMALATGQPLSSAWPQTLSALRLGGSTVPVTLGALTGYLAYKNELQRAEEMADLKKKVDVERAIKRSQGIKPSWFERIADIINVGPPQRTGMNP